MESISRTLFLKEQYFVLNHFSNRLDKFCHRIWHLDKGLSPKKSLISSVQIVLCMIEAIFSCTKFRWHIYLNVTLALALIAFFCFKTSYFIIFFIVNLLFIFLRSFVHFFKNIYINYGVFKEIGYLSFTGMICIKDKEKKIESLLEAFTGNEGYFGNCLSIDLSQLSKVPESVVFSVDQQLLELPDNLAFDYGSLSNSMVMCFHKLQEQDLERYTEEEREQLRLQIRSNTLIYDNLPALIEHLVDNNKIINIIKNIETTHKDPSTKNILAEVKADYKITDNSMRIANYNNKLYMMFMNSLDDESLSYIDKVDTLMSLSRLADLCSDTWSSEIYHDMKKWFVTDGSFHDIVLGCVQEFKEVMLKSLVAKYGDQELWHVINNFKKDYGEELGLSYTSVLLDKINYICIDDGIIKLLRERFIQEYKNSSDELIVFVKEKMLEWPEIAYKANIYLEKYIQSLEDRRGQAFTKQKPGCSTPAFVMDELINIDEGTITEKGIAIILLELGVLK